MRREIEYCRQSNLFILPSVASNKHLACRKHSLEITVNQWSGNEQGRGISTFLVSVVTLLLRARRCPERQKTHPVDDAFELLGIHAATPFPVKMVEGGGEIVEPPPLYMCLSLIHI